MQRHVYAHTSVDASLETLLDVVTRDPLVVLGDRSEDGVPVTTLRATVAGTQVHRQVEVRTGEIEPIGRHAHRLRLSWHATHAENLYPIMHGELEFSLLSRRPPRCAVAFIGHYQLPLGIFGAIGDAMMGHRIAEETVTSFLDDVCERLLREAGAQPAH